MRSGLLMVLLVLGVASGCQSLFVEEKPRGDIVFPLWFTRPVSAECSAVPVSLQSLKLPAPLDALAKEYGLPGWFVYGTVRAIGSNEFIVQGTLRSFTMTDGLGENSVVVDKIQYDVPIQRARAFLAPIARECRAAKDDLERRNILGRYVIRRFGGFILFELTGGGGDLLLQSGESPDPLETFGKNQVQDLPEIGWQETATHYVVTAVGEFSFGDPFHAFRKTEEEAIYDLAKGMVLKFSHLGKKFNPEDMKEGVAEDTRKEDVRVGLRGVRVVRRAVEVPHRICLVQISVPRSGIARY